MDTLSVLLASRVKAELFRLLFTVPAREIHVRELARRARLNEATVRQELRRLSGLGLIEVRRDGNRAYYRANPRHPIYPDLRNLVLKTSGLAEVLREALRHPAVGLAFVFGSIAAGTERPESDVDLMVIGEIGLREVSKLLSGVGGKLGREVNPHVLTREEFGRRKRTRDHFLGSVLNAPKMFVIGDDLELEAMGR
ncbi:MAG: nucleotidyltransferase domain-containing protein [Planctomycetes bacterium]|nr:nucleotidyltransferase domain-containing protein [Planctomycetota bacterium]